MGKTGKTAWFGGYRSKTFPFKWLSITHGLLWLKSIVEPLKVEKGVFCPNIREDCVLNTNLKYYLYFCVAANTRKMISWPILPNLTSKCKSSVSKYLFKIIWSSFLVRVISFLAALFKCRQQYNIVKYIANTGKCADKKRGVFHPNIREVHVF